MKVLVPRKYHSRAQIFRDAEKKEEKRNSEKQAPHEKPTTLEQRRTATTELPFWGRGLVEKKTTREFKLVLLARDLAFYSNATADY